MSRKLRQGFTRVSDLIRGRVSRIPDIFTNPERFVETPDQLGKIAASYEPTYNFGETYINDYHRSLSTAPLGRMGIAMCVDLGIDGYLHRGDGLKLYELAYFAEHDVLELGTHKGLSTSIMSRALRDRKRPHRLVTVDIDENASASAHKSLSDLALAKNVDFVISDATAYMDKLIDEQRRFAFVFIDHWHGYEATFEAATRLHQLLLPKGFAAFHDYNDLNNAEPEHVHKVYQAVADTLCKDARFQFCTISECIGVFRKVL